MDFLEKNQAVFIINTVDVFVPQQHSTVACQTFADCLNCYCTHSITVGLSHTLKVMHVPTMDSIKFCISERNFEVTALVHDSWVSF